MRKLKNNSKGITLVALVVTVIVLIILASVSINLVLGDHGILKMAKDARDKTEKAQIAEKIQLAEIAATANSNAEIDYDALVAELTNEFGTKGTDWDISDKTETPWEVTINGEKYVISSSVKTNGEVPKVSDANPGVLEGTGTEDDPYTINCIEDLVAFAYEVNNNGNLYEGKIVTLGCDLDFQSDNSYMNPEKPYTFNEKGYYEVPSGGPAIKTIMAGKAYVGWAPIGKGDNDGFAGTFDGKNHTISNLYMEPFSYGGLFGCAKNDIIIKNLGIANCNIFSGKEAGGILAYTTKTAEIINCFCSGTVKGMAGTQGIGGIIRNECWVIK